MNNCRKQIKGTELWAEGTGAEQHIKTGPST